LSPTVLTCTLTVVFVWAERFSFVSACETENQFFSPVVPFRCCDRARRFSEAQQA
jgi:hypothetical protein